MELDIKNNSAGRQFETTVNGHTAVVQYRMRNNVITVLHTIVPKELEGQGIAAALTRHVLTYIEAEKLELVPLCPYMAAYLKKHPEYQSLVKQ